MIKEIYEDFVDGQAVIENDIATVVGYYDSIVIFKDDAENILFLSADLPELFEVGTVSRKDLLVPIEQADPDLRGNILDALKGVNA